MNEPTSAPRFRGAHSAVRVEPRRRFRALVVDDDPEILAFAAEALNSFAPGFDVATARDPQQAAAWLETFQPDLLVTELKFAGEGTGGLPDRLRADPKTRFCRVLVTSSLAPGDPRVERARLEADAVLVKPIGLPFLLETIRRVMNHNESH